MLFNSFEFIFFFIALVIIHFSLPHRWRVLFLLIISYYFYMRWSWQYGFLILGVTIVNYICGYGIERAKSICIKKLWVAITIVFSILTIGYFKYFNFFNSSVAQIANSLGFDYLVPSLDILLPVGVSFFTFQAMSYTIDVYRGNSPVEKNFLIFALYISFFPQLVAGPIERSSRLLKQFKTEKHLDAERLLSGIQLIVWGLFKKVVIADRLSVYVNSVYGNVDGSSGATLLLATYFFTFQIYCDFSGYSDIAIGVARILGYDLMQNFRLPYLSKSIGEFWKRWHISLSSWFADYVYIPLGGSRVSVLYWGRNILVVFLLSGLWHGANWTFVIWGGLHAMYYFIEAGVKKILPKWWRTPDFIKIILVFHLVVLGWIFFRANNITQAFKVVYKIFSDFGRLSLGVSQIYTLLSILLVIFLICIQILQEKRYLSLYFSPSRFPQWLRAMGYGAILLLISLLGVSSSEFIYFQF